MGLSVGTHKSPRELEKRVVPRVGGRGVNWSFAVEPRGMSVKVRILCWEEEHARLRSFERGGARIGPY